MLQLEVLISELGSVDWLAPGTVVVSEVTWSREMSSSWTPFSPVHRARKFSAVIGRQFWRNSLLQEKCAHWCKFHDWHSVQQSQWKSLPVQCHIRFVWFWLNVWSCQPDVEAVRVSDSVDQSIHQSSSGSWWQCGVDIWILEGRCADHQPPNFKGYWLLWSWNKPPGTPCITWTRNAFSSDVVTKLHDDATDGQTVGGHVKENSRDSHLVSKDEDSIGIETSRKKNDR